VVNIFGIKCFCKNTKFRGICVYDQEKVKYDGWHGNGEGDEGGWEILRTFTVKFMADEDNPVAVHDRCCCAYASGVCRFLHFPAVHNPPDIASEEMQLSEF